MEENHPSLSQFLDPMLVPEALKDATGKYAPNSPRGSDGGLDSFLNAPAMQNASNVVEDIVAAFLTSSHIMLSGYAQGLLFHEKRRVQRTLQHNITNFLPQTPEDSFYEFRSDFIHLSTSLTSSVRRRKASSHVTSNSFHLTPKTFAHFWAWWDLFDRFLSIPIRQGRQFTNTRPQSKKFGKHLATLKYKLSVSQLFISHVYMDESRECWSDGTSKFVGIKAFVDSFEADMHQREQEAIVSGIIPGTTKKIRHKPFYIAEVKLGGLQLRGVCATFAEPLRRLIDIGGNTSDARDSYPTSQDTERPPSLWVDKDDFVEVDWRTPDCEPILRMPPVASCPRFTYFRRSSGHLSEIKAGDNYPAALESSRFGDEDTHACLMGQEPCLCSLPSTS